MVDRHDAPMCAARRRAADRVLVSLRRGLTREVEWLAHEERSLRNLDAEKSQLYRLILMINLKPEVFAAYSEATALQRDALTHCRNGDLGAAEHTLAHAREVTDSLRPTQEAFLAAHSFQRAADALLSYRSSDSRTAVRALREALRDCKELREGFGYPVEARCVHLVRNIARVEVDSRNYREAARLTCALLNRLDSSRSSWPFPDLEVTANVEKLTDAERWVLTDHVIGVVSDILLSGDEDSRRQLADAFLYTHNAQDSRLLSRTRVWVDAMVAYAEGEQGRFLTRCAEFFEPGPEYLTTAWTQALQRLGMIDVTTELASVVREQLRTRLSRRSPPG